jgi:hypothetical protein
MEITEALARRCLEVVDRGLVAGLGAPEPGKFCVEAAICFALGEPHSDRPSCVGEAVRNYKIRINDGPWSSDDARTKGLRHLAIAQLCSDQINQRAFADYVVLEGVKRLLPIALLAAANRVGGPKGEAIKATIAACESATDLPSARKAALAEEATA